MPHIAQRPDRISLRVSAQAKRTLERAAGFAGKSLTDFSTEAAIQRADAVVREREGITLTAGEWDRVQRLLLAPPTPNEKLSQAMAGHARAIRR